MPAIARMFIAIVNSQLFIGLAAGSLCLHTNFQLGQSPDLALAGFVLLSTLFCYRLLNQSHLLQRGWQAITGSPEIITMLCGLLALLLFIPVEPVQRLYILPALLFAALYALPLLQSGSGALKKAKKLLPGRQKGYSKLLLICLAWSWTTVALPFAVHPESIFGLLPAAMLVSRALLIAGITIPFDIRDRLLDNPDMKTLPQRIGVERSLIVAVAALLSTSIGLECLHGLKISGRGLFLFC